MGKHNTTAEQHRAREKTLYRYINALDRGDIDTVINILHEAENDALLEQMIFDTHTAYQLEEPMPQNSTPEQEQPSRIAYTDDQMAAGQLNRQPQQKKKRRPMLLQLLAAVIIAALLIGGSLFLFQSHSPATQVAGSHTSPPQVGDTIVTITNAGQVAARQLNSGTIIWQKTLPLTVKTQFDLDNGQPGLVIQNHVAYIAYQGHIWALQLKDGKQLWEQQFGSDKTSEVIGDNPPQIMADQNLVYVSGYLGSTLYAIDQKTGALHWHYASDTPSPLLTIGPGLVYVVKNNDNDHNGVYALNSDSGKEVWGYSSTMPISAAMADNVLYIQIPHSLANEPAGASKGPMSLLALNATTGKLKWSTLVPAAGPSPLTVTDGVIALFNGKSFCAYQISNGASTWCTPPTAPDAVSSDLTKLLAADGNIYGIALLTRTDKTNLKPTDNHMKPSIEAIEAKTGAIHWEKQPSEINLPTSISNNILVMYTDFHQLQALSLPDGQPLWTIQATEKAPITNIVVGN